MILARVKQLAAALTARITPADRQLVARWLTASEQVLFWRMNRPDQYHALKVTGTAGRMAAGRPEIRPDVLIKSALLHDVGKVRGDVSTVDKVLAVLADALAPGWARKMGRPGRGSRGQNFRHALYVYFQHPARGAAMLQAAGVSREITEIVRRHHAAARPDDPAELAILRAADNLN